MIKEPPGTDGAPQWKGFGRRARPAEPPDLGPPPQDARSRSGAPVEPLLGPVGEGGGGAAGPRKRTRLPSRKAAEGPGGAPGSPHGGSAATSALVEEVRAYLQANKISQLTAGQEANVSQGVVSQWLGGKYPHKTTTIEDSMRAWLHKRRGGVGPPPPAPAVPEPEE